MKQLQDSSFVEFGFLFNRDALQTTYREIKKKEKKHGNFLGLDFHFLKIKSINSTKLYFTAFYLPKTKAKGREFDEVYNNSAFSEQVEFCISETDRICKA